MRNKTCKQSVHWRCYQGFRRSEVLPWLEHGFQEARLFKILSDNHYTFALVVVNVETLYRKLEAPTIILIQIAAIQCYR